MLVYHIAVQTLEFHISLYHHTELRISSYLNELNVGPQIGPTVCIREVCMCVKACVYVYVYKSGLSTFVPCLVPTAYFFYRQSVNS